MSDSGRAQFGWPDPGVDRTLPEDAWNVQQPAQDSDPLEAFCLCILDAQYVDMLSLKGNFRQVHERQGTAEDDPWTCRDVNP